MNAALVSRRDILLPILLKFTRTFNWMESLQKIHEFSKITTKFKSPNIVNIVLVHNTLFGINMGLNGQSIWSKVRSILSHPIDFRCFLDIRLAVGLASPFCPFSPSLAMRLWYFPVMSRLSDVLTLYFSYTLLPKILSVSTLQKSAWSKTTLIHSCMGDSGVGSPSFKKEFYHYALGTQCTNFQQKISSNTSWETFQTSRPPILLCKLPKTWKSTPCLLLGNFGIIIGRVVPF